MIASATISINEFKDAFERVGISTGVYDLSLTLDEKINYKVHFWKGGKPDGCNCWMCADEKLRQNFWKYKKYSPEEVKCPEVVANYCVDILKNTEKGSILVFLTGEATIKRTKELLSEKLQKVPRLKKTPILPIFSRLGEQEVSRRFNYNPTGRRVLITTDIAETSHTLNDVVYLIESGYIKQNQWDANDLTSSLPTIRHSQAGCRQRFGRVGRSSDGYVYTLYTEEEFKNFPEQTTPEIFRNPAEDLLLTSRAAGINEEIRIIGEADDKDAFLYELERSVNSIKTEGFMDEYGNVTEDGLEMFRIPLTTQKKALLDLADEQGCLLEMVIFLEMSTSDKSGDRTGAELYSPRGGLLLWDPRWSAETKMRVWRIHEALKFGCDDELEFIFKIIHCYLGAMKTQEENLWALEHFVNQFVIKEALDEAEVIMELFLTKAKNRKKRAFDITRINKVRLILSYILKLREVEIFEYNGKLLYSLISDRNITGYISRLNCGKYKSGDRALLFSATKKSNISDIGAQVVSVTCSLIRLNTKQTYRKDHIYIDQVLSVGTRVMIFTDKKGISFIGKVLAAPNQITIQFGEKIDFEMLGDNYLRESYVSEVRFDDNREIDKLNSLKFKIYTEWYDEREDKIANIIGWTFVKGYLKAVVAPMTQKEELAAIKKAEKAEVYIKEVFKGYEDERGWILARTNKGFEFPIETTDITSSYIGQGIKKLKHTKFEVAVKSAGIGKKLVLSNIERSLTNLHELKLDIEQNGQFYTIAFVEKVEPDRQRIIVYLIPEPGVIHFFYVRMKSDSIKLEIGSKVPIVLRLKDRPCFMYHELKSYQIESINNKKDWKYDHEAERIFFPYCLDSDDMKSLNLGKAEKEKIIKMSWSQFFEADINYQAVCESIEKGQQIDGTIAKITRFKDTDQISGAIVNVNIDGFFLSSFVPIKALLLSDDDMDGVLKLGDELAFKIIDFKDDFSQLILRRVDD